jgi:Family of unknown function (DUF6494)
MQQRCRPFCTADRLHKGCALAPVFPSLLTGPVHRPGCQHRHAPEAVFGKEVLMDEDKFNMSLRKFLKQVGVTSQREIERIVRHKGPQQGKLKVKIVLTAAGTNLNHVVEEEIDLG